MSYESNEIAAINAEERGNWRQAMDYWNKCLAHVERVEPNNKQKIEYINLKIKEAEKRK